MNIVSNSLLFYWNWNMHAEVFKPCFGKCYPVSTGYNITGSYLSTASRIWPLLPWLETRFQNVNEPRSVHICWKHQLNISSTSLHLPCFLNVCCSEGSHLKWVVFNADSLTRNKFFLKSTFVLDDHQWHQLMHHYIQLWKTHVFYSSPRPTGLLQ